MKASELRIGNLVFNTTVQKEIEVYPIMISQLAKVEDKDTNIRSIPLTVNHLKDFGFRKKDDEYVKDVDGWGEYRYTISRNSHFEGFFISIDKIVIREIYYVHELQNLWHALTQRELKKESFLHVTMPY